MDGRAGGLHLEIACITCTNRSPSKEKTDRRVKSSIIYETHPAKISALWQVRLSYSSEAAKEERYDGVYRGKCRSKSKE